MSVSLSNSHLLDVVDDGVSVRGYTQDWYVDDWQVRAGCGPTTAAFMVLYRLVADGYIEKPMTVEAVRVELERFWSYVTPRRGGLFKTCWMVEGLVAYLTANDYPYRVHSLPISVYSWRRPNVSEVVAFIEQGLLADSPVAFLNRHRGNESGLDTWHWVPIVELKKGEPFVATVLDDRMERYFSPSDWLNDTLLGGGLVYIEKR